jgi:putative glutamine amidotransferase
MSPSRRRKPLIAITVGKQNPRTPTGEVQAVTTGCNVNYVNAVVRAGGAPVLLPRIADADAIRTVVESADGLLLTGGGDVVSLAYGEEPHLTSKYQDPVRDEMELEATRAALDAELPILGVCRGLQLLNVARGGTLIQDIPSQVENAVKHYGEGLDPVLLHTIDIEPDSLLACVARATTMAVNSYHHQAAKDLGAGLRVNCRARDGVVEGLESSDGRPILALQFHPEEHAGIHPAYQTFFDWLIEEASSRRV